MRRRGPRVGPALALGVPLRVKATGSALLAKTARAALPGARQWTKLLSRKTHARICASAQPSALAAARERAQRSVLPCAEHVLGLPDELLSAALGFLAPADVGRVAAVSRAWRARAGCDSVWRPLFARQFPAAAAPPTTPALACFRDRLRDPGVGDSVEVAWEGRFRLETNDVYQGLAWWLAEVVAKDPKEGRYKIHYPGWESRWDEWVDRGRLRWRVRCDAETRIAVGDEVEVLCSGLSVPGAWLRTQVTLTHNDYYKVGNVVPSGTRWVRRERLRLVARGPRRGGWARLSRLLGRLSRRTSLSGGGGGGAVVAVEGGL